jgi:hypothetical protein
MAKSKTPAVREPQLIRNPNMLFVLIFFVVMAVNALVLHFANAMFPMQVVLGTYSLSYFWSLVLSSGVIALITTFVMPFITDVANQMKKVLSPVEMMIIFFVVNFGAIWLVTRESQVFGLGVSSWLVVLVLAVVMDFLQGLAVMLLDKMK